MSPHPEDNGAILSGVDEIREYEYARGYAAGVADSQPPPPNPARERVGIQVFPDRRDLSYWDHESTYMMLQYLGIRNVRGGIGPATTQRTIDFYNRCYDELGIRACLTVGAPRVALTLTQWLAVEQVVEKLRGVARLSGWNEPNHNRNGAGPTLDKWEEKTIRHNDALYQRFGGAGGHTITSAQLWSGNKAKHDADLQSLAATTAGLVDYGDTFDEIAWHLYQPGVDRMRDYETLYRDLFGPKPIVCTETGMSTAPNQTQGALAMSEDEQAVYLVAHVGMYLGAGHSLYWFELRDELDPTGTNREDWLGLFRADGSPKPAATALRDLLAA